MRAGKGSVIRPKSTALYADEIEALFNHEVRDKALGVLSREQAQDPAALKRSVGSFIRSVVPVLPQGAAGEAEGFFAFGHDSVQITELASNLRAQLHTHLNPTDSSIVAEKVMYPNSTIDSLSVFLGGLLGIIQAMSQRSEEPL